MSINVTDYSGNLITTYNISYMTVNNIPPNVSLLLPVAGNYSTATLFNASANSTTDVSSVSFGYSQLCGSITWFSASEGSAGYWNATLDPAGIEEGLYNLSVNATDSAGNQNVTSNATIILLDAKGPAVAIVAPATGTKTGIILVNATVSDSGTGLTSGASNVTWRYESDSVTGNWTALNNTAGSNYNGTFNTSAVSDGTYTVRINATDFIGNQNTTVTVGITVDNVEDTTEESPSSSSSSGGGGSSLAYSPSTGSITIEGKGTGTISFKDPS